MEIKFSDLEISPPLPVLWIGENNYTVERIGRMVRIHDLRYFDGTTEKNRNFIITIAKITSTTEFTFSPGDYIIAGGVPIQLMHVKHVVYAKRLAIPELEKLLKLKAVPANGMKAWTYVAICDDPATRMAWWEELTDNEKELIINSAIYDPPLLYSIDVEKRIITLIEIKK